MKNYSRKYVILNFFSRPLIIYGFFVVALFLGIHEFNFGTQGDDVFVLADVLRARIFSFDISQYVPFARSRFFLLFTMNHIHEFLGCSRAHTQFFFMLCWTINPILLFVFLKRFVTPYVALLAALFFLVYTGKYEVVPIISGGVYHIVIGILILSLLILFSELSWYTKFLIITPLMFISFHLYEILIPVTVLFPAYYFYVKFKTLKPVRFSEMFFSFFPIFAALEHVWLLSGAGSTIWDERIGSHLSLFKLLAYVPVVFLKSLDTFIGPRYLHEFSKNFNGFFFWVKESHHFMIIGSLFIFMASILFITYKILTTHSIKNDTSSSNKLYFCVMKNALFWIALFLIFIPSIISIPIFIGAHFVPSRFTYIPSLGAALLFAWCMLSSKKRFKLSILILFSLWTFLDAIMMKDILLQYNETARLDTKIRKEIAAYSMHLKPLDTVFLSFYENHFMQHGALKKASYQFENGGAQSLLLIDNPSLLFEDPQFFLGNRLAYKHYLRKEHEKETTGLLSLLSNQKKDAALYPFILREDETICAVTDITVIDNQKKALFTMKTAHHIINPALCTTHAYVDNVFISDHFIDNIDNPKMILIYGTDNNRILKIQGELAPNDPPLKAILKDKQSGQILGEKILDKSGQFKWEVTLSPKIGLRTFEISNQSHTLTSKRVIWHIENISLN